MPDQISVAIIQHSPVFLDLPATVAKTITLTEEAARKGARVVTFGETWLPGYPAWLDYCSDAALWDHAPSKEVFARLRQNSVVVPGKEGDGGPSAVPFNPAGMQSNASLPPKETRARGDRSRDRMQVFLATAHANRSAGTNPLALPGRM